jgi:hypothetical protein
MKGQTFRDLLWRDVDIEKDMEKVGYSVQDILPIPNRNPSESSPTEAIEKAVGKHKLYEPIGKSGTKPVIYWEGGDNHQRIFKSFIEERLNMGRKNPHS